LSSESELKMGALFGAAIVPTIAGAKSEPVLRSESELKMGSPFSAGGWKQRANFEVGI
jgi:hypothetical protein